MGNINMGRVLLGGLLAGVVLNIGEFLFNGVLMANQMKEWMAQHNLTEPGTTFLVVATVLTFLLGIFLVWLYAAIRPRLGAGPKTAICAASILWIAICIYSGLIYGLLLAIPMNLVLMGIAWCFVEYVLAALAGAWVYKEA